MLVIMLGIKTIDRYYFTIRCVIDTVLMNERLMSISLSHFLDQPIRCMTEARKADALREN